jgi:16S rRNA (adenine1518-N6/adenine1519-N6)-dimethyltransferase
VPGEHVVEIGAGLGSLTVALAATGAEVLAVEFDRALLPALEEVLEGAANVSVRHADAMKFDWTNELGTSPAGWVLCANLPYSVATPLVLDLLDKVPAVRRLVVMVQREVGERLVANAGDDGYGAASVRVAYRATPELLRRVPPDVFWPRPNVDSVVVRLDRRATPPVDVDPDDLWRVVDAGFAERRKTMRNALRRLGLSSAEAEGTLAECDIPSDARAEELDLAAFARLARAVAA